MIDKSVGRNLIYQNEKGPILTETVCPEYANNVGPDEAQAPARIAISAVRSHVMDLRETKDGD